MRYRDFDPARDREAAYRIWREIGWLEKGKEEAVDILATAGQARVAELNGQAECQVLTAPGTLRYLEEDLRLCAVLAVATSMVARRQGLAKRLTAETVALAAAVGAQVAGLSIFDQGFYNQLGFGTGPYEHWLSFDPAQLSVGVRARPPYRLTPDDWEAVHRARLARYLGHGYCTLEPAAVTRAEMQFGSNVGGLGYRDGLDGALSHFIVYTTDSAAHGPYMINWFIYQTPAQLLELLALIHNLGDQIHGVRMQEPQGIQLQDLLAQPFRGERVTRGGKFQQQHTAAAYWQMRICDLPGCLERTHLSGETLRFALRLTDPIEPLLEPELAWRGVGGEYTVTLGPESSARPGADPALPLLEASVGAFTRMWLGVRPATGLAITDHLSGPKDLLRRLDQVLRLPIPQMNWDY